MNLDVRLPNQPRLSRVEIQEILDNISIGIELYENPKFRLMESGDGFLVQLVYREKDCETGNIEDQHARKWYVSAYSTPTEVIRTVYKAVLTSLEHRLGEWFTYKGERVMSPHRSLTHSDTYPYAAFGYKPEKVPGWITVDEVSHDCQRIPNCT